MGKTRVDKVAREVGLGSDELIQLIQTKNLGFVVTAADDEMTDEQADTVRAQVKKDRRRQVLRGRDTGGGVVRRRRRAPAASEPETAVEPEQPAAASSGNGASSEPVSEPAETEESPRHVGAVVRRRNKRVVAQPAGAMPVTAATARTEPAEDVAEEAPEAAATAEKVEPPASEEETREAAAAAPEATPAAPEAAETGDDEEAVEPVAVTSDDEDEDDDEDALAAEVNRRKTRPQAPARPARPKAPSNIVGAIDPEIIRKRLAADQKDFKPGPSTRPERRGGGERRPSGRRTVVDPGSAGYGVGRRRPPRRKGKSKSRSGPVERTQITQAAEHKRILRISDAITVGELAHEMGVKSNEVIKFLMGEGMMATMNQALDVETAELIAENFKFTVEDVTFREETYLESEEDAEEDLELRAPVVTVMGHVDHGKTSLLDAIRDTRVTAGEAGGITQHIGASTVFTDSGNKVVFLDTPGHEAFTALRARGAKVTDLVVLVVAADDGVMPQTVEAINHARAAEVPIIVAVNKIDKAGANPQRVKQALTEYELIPEEWGGKTIFVEVSALEGTNIEDLLEMIQLQSEILELRANPGKPARGVVLEAFKSSGRGTVATLVVQEGTLRQGDIVVSGPTYGRVRTMTDEHGDEVSEVGPSTPVEITGLSGVPDAGEAFFVGEDEKVAKEFTENVSQRRRASALAARKVDPWAALRDTKKLQVIIKGDVQGSVEALAQSLDKQSNEQVEVDIIHTGVGGITESDVQLAIASHALVIGFNVRPEARANELAKREGVHFELHSIIYDVIDRVREAMAGLLEPVYEERALGRAEVRETFSVPKLGTIAGCYVIDGRIVRGAQARLVRDGKVIYESKIGSLRRFKDDVREVKSGFECGLSVDNYNDIKIGDIVEAFEMEAVAATLQ